jgi:hypothetical protein
VFLEDALKADLLKVFEKHAEKVQEFKKVEKKERFNSFLLADALGQRNKEKLWVLYHQALGEGIAARRASRHPVLADKSDALGHISQKSR